MPKKEIRIVAWDDCAFDFKDRRVQIIGTIFRGGKFMDGLLSTAIEKDGMDVTEKIAECVSSSRHYDQLSLIMLDGISFAGFNIVDIKKLSDETRLPVVAVIRKRPDVEKFLDAAKKLPDYRKREAAVRSAGEVFSWAEIFYQKANIETSEAEQIFKLACTQSNIPEPLRVSHLIASGLSRPGRNGFESRGRA